MGISGGLVGKSRFGLERFGMVQSCHGLRQSASPVEIMLTHYPQMLTH
jgi:hypothetical protein